MRYKYHGMMNDGTPAGTVEVTAIRYLGRTCKIAAADWACSDADGGRGCLAKDTFAFDHAQGFPVNRGAGKKVRRGDWVVRFPDATVRVLAPDVFESLYSRVAP